MRRLRGTGGGGSDLWDLSILEPVLPRNTQSREFGNRVSPALDLWKPARIGH
jgi:hypothetical protein